MENPEPSRRRRLREQTTGEIKANALDLMAEGGPDAITLRAIARRMGMTPNAIYGYFATRDDLVTTLIDEVYDSLVDQVEAARDVHTEPGARLLAWAETFRAWSLANPEGFRLIYGDPVHDYRPPSGGTAPDARARACLGLVGLTVALWDRLPDGETGDYDWSDFDPELVAHVRAAHPGKPPALIAVALRLWGRLHGLVSLEIYGHLGHQIREPAKLYRDEIRGLLRSLGRAP